MTPCLNTVNCAVWVRVLCWNSLGLQIQARFYINPPDRVLLTSQEATLTQSSITNCTFLSFLLFQLTRSSFCIYLGMDHARLLSRSFFHHPSNSSSNHTCPSVNESGPTIIPLVGSMSYHTLSSIVAGVCLVLTSVLALISLMRHAAHYSSPVQQR